MTGFHVFSIVKQFFDFFSYFFFFYSNFASFLSIYAFFRKINHFFLLFIKRFCYKIRYILVTNQEKGRFVEPPFIISMQCF